MKIKEILAFLEKDFPLFKQEAWDHSGLQLGNADNEVSRILITLNVDQGTIQQAISNHVELIISHHPFFFHGVKEINTASIQGSNIESLLEHKITVYAMHTNYDALYMNQLLLEKLGCTDIKPVDSSGTLRAGQLSEPLSFKALLKQIKAVFNMPVIRYCGHPPREVRTIAMCGGSGHDFINDALPLYDVYITGDISYSHAMDVILKPRGALIDVPHFIEAAFKEDIFTRLNEWPDVQLILAMEKDYFTYV